MGQVLQLHNFKMRRELKAVCISCIFIGSGLFAKMLTVKKERSVSHKETFPSDGCNGKTSTQSRRISLNLTAPDWSDLKKRFKTLESGGRFKSSNCSNPDRVAIIIPYKDRDVHLRILLQNLHPFLQRQHIHYGIYVVEPVLNITFNKAAMMNIGFKEALLRMDYQCFIFHDVDLIPEDDANLYTCPRMPRHMSVAINKFNYKLYYPKWFGGVTALSKDHFQMVNGFSNLYFGWGKEDDDMYLRLRANGLTIGRYPEEIARYTMIKHKRDKLNKDNPRRAKLLRKYRRYPHDGLNSLRYYLLDTVEEGLFTKFLVRLDPNDYNVQENIYHAPIRAELVVGTLSTNSVSIVRIMSRADTDKNKTIVCTAYSLWANLRFTVKRISA